MRAGARYCAAGLLLSLAGLSIGFIGVELAVRYTGLDFRMIVRPLFFQGADLSVHRISDDPILHYELNPNSEFHGFNPYSHPPRAYQVSIDENGARRPAHRAAKPPGTFRILAFGGSTLYGGSVNDSDTLPAALERRLNDLAVGTGPANGEHRSDPKGSGRDEPPRAAGRFEVWNFGVSAYTLGQAAHLARQKLRLLSPDLILVQHHNRGCWPFLMPDGYRPETYPPERIATDPHFYEEYFPAPDMVPAWVHQALMRHSAAYRCLIAGMVKNQACNEAVAERLSADEARRLSREAAQKNVPVVYFTIPADQRRLARTSLFPELREDRFIDLFQPDREADFYDVHPRADTLDEFAKLLVDQLRARHLLPASRRR
jgi:hypothetical protein